jgi:hypothetical protein
MKFSSLTHRNRKDHLSVDLISRHGIFHEKGPQRRAQSLSIGQCFSAKRSHMFGLRLEYSTHDEPYMLNLPIRAKDDG